MQKIDLLSLNLTEMEELLASLGEKKYRAGQIFQWVNLGIKDYDLMTNLSKQLRRKLQEDTFITNIKIEKKIISKLDATIKYLFLLEDGNIVEGVAMQHNYGLTICISSQVGCLMGCKFCASTLGGLIRNLRAGEMLDQILAVQKDLGFKITNIVIMGSGEPLHNYKEVINFLKIVNNDKGLNIGNRHITLSTCGLVEEIRSLAGLQIPINLAISLHAPNDKIRQDLMPIAKKYSLEELIEACKYYLLYNRRRITFEYGLIKNVNDQDSHAFELSKLLKGLLCHVNLIPINKVDESQLEKSSSEQIKSFQNILKSNGIETTIRKEMGSDIHAACGQLRNTYLVGKQ